MDKSPNEPLMPKATAVWLIENTSLTFEQVADFCSLHLLEVQGIADEEVSKGLRPVDPVAAGQITKEEITRCEQNPKLRLSLSESAKRLMKEQIIKKKSAKYTPIARRQDKPDGVAWLLKNCPEMSDIQIAKLVGATKNTVELIRDKTHWNSQNIRARDPVLLGLCTQTELDRLYQLAKEKAAQKMSKDKQDALEELQN